MSKIILKALEIIQTAETIFKILVPVLETLVKRDLNGDNKIGR